MTDQTTLFSDQELEQLALTTKVRRRIVQTLASKTALPTDKNDRDFLIHALDGLDKSVFAKAKLQAQVASTQETGEIVRTIGKLLYNAQATQSQLPPRSSDPVIPASYQIPDLVPGEMDQRPASRTVDEFLTAMGQ